MKYLVLIGVISFYCINMFGSYNISNKTLNKKVINKIYGPHGMVVNKKQGYQTQQWIYKFELIKKN